MNYLEKILETKRSEVEKLDSLENYKKEHDNYPRLDIRTIYWSQKLDVIAEIKRKSPSKGALAQIDDPVDLAKQYEQGGATLISVLTDAQYFGAKENDLVNIRENIALPVLRKDFIVDERQIFESYFMGADAILLIVSAFENKHELARLYELAISMGLQVIVEAHDQKEYDFANSIDAKAIGVNTRDLTSFEEDTLLAQEIFSNKNPNIVNIWESGIIALEDAKRAYDSGADALLIGQGLVQSNDPAEFIKQIRQIS